MPRSGRLSRWVQAPREIDVPPVVAQAERHRVGAHVGFDVEHPVAAIGVTVDDDVVERLAERRDLVPELRSAAGTCGDQREHEVDGEGSVVERRLEPEADEKGKSARGESPTTRNRG